MFRVLRSNLLQVNVYGRQHWFRKLDFGTASARRAFCAGTEPLVLVERPAERAPGVALLRLNRPKQLNALNNSLMRALTEKLRELDTDPQVRAMVLTGNEKAFAAGADIKEMNSKDYAAVTAEDMLAQWGDLSRVRTPLIAAVSGFALGGGCELAMACDMIVAAETARFGQPEIALGTIPGYGGTQRLVRAVGKSKAMHWVLTGDQFTAAEAERAGLVAKVVPKEKLLDEALEIAGKIASYSKPAVLVAKECVDRAFETSLAEGLLYERRSFHSTWALEDRREGMTAFSEKRKAEWKQR